LAQNASGLVSAGELLARPEIAQALEGQPATAVRSVEAANGRRVLYAAAPVFSDDGSITQIVYLAAPLPDAQWAALPAALRQQFTGQIAAVILLASLTAGAAGLLLARRISRMALQAPPRPWVKGTQKPSANWPNWGGLQPHDRPCAGRSYKLPLSRMSRTNCATITYQGHDETLQTGAGRPGAGRSWHHEPGDRTIRQ
jgi:hypothetical protein